MIYGSVYSLDHRAEVKVPEDVYRRFGHMLGYSIFRDTAANGMHSGCDTYSEVIEWAEGGKSECEAFVAAWDQQIAKWKEVIRVEEDK